MKKGAQKYRGPGHLVHDVELAMQKLSKLLPVEVSEHDDHCVVRVCGLDHRKAVVEAVAVYLVGAIAGCIEFNLQVRTALFDENTITRDLHRDVVAVIGSDNSIDDVRKTYERNPWLWEGISHLVLHLSLKNKQNHPPDRLLTKSSIHLDVKDHGLDVIALYGTHELGVTAGECKAYLDRPADAIADAANRLSEVDKELRDAEIRIALSQFRASLAPEQQDRLVGTFWRDERAYFPMVCCDSTQSVDWGGKRKVLKRLKPPTNRKYLVPAAIDAATSFFDGVSDAMRKYVAGDE